jgi:hypothetical protein
MTTSNEYRQYAEECLLWARETIDQTERQQFLDMASTWLQAAALNDGKLPTVSKAVSSLVR